MGTRADFYIGRGENAEWLGSTAWDGYPEGISLCTGERDRFGSKKREDWPADAHLFQATTEQDFRARLDRYFLHRDDVTRPADGWPWPWDNSATTDCAYAFDDGKVWLSWFGEPWLDVFAELQRSDDEERKDADGPRAVFPDMSARKNVQYGGLAFRSDRCRHEVVGVTLSGAENDVLSSSVGGRF